MTNAPEQAADVELVLFEIGGHLYGADATQITRIARPSSNAVEVEALGVLTQGARGLVLRAPDGEEGELKVDAVLGFRMVKLESLRRIPPVVAPSPYAIGVWLGGGQPILLLDLSETLKAQGRQ